MGVEVDFIVDFMVDFIVDFMVDFEVVGLGGHGFHGYPGFLVEEILSDEVVIPADEDSKVEELVTGGEGVGFAIVELAQMGGSDMTGGCSEVGFGGGTGCGVEVGSGLSVDEAPGPPPSQVILKDGFPILI